MQYVKFGFWTWFKVYTTIGLVGFISYTITVTKPYLVAKADGITLPAPFQNAPEPRSEAISTEVSLTGPIDSDGLTGALTVIAAAAAAGKPVHVFLDTPGGDAIATLAFIMEVQKLHANIACDTGMMVASAGSYIYEGICTTRHANEATMFLFHGAAGALGGKANNMEDAAKFMRTINHSLAVLMAGRLGMTPDQFLNWIEGHDRWLTTDELKAMHGVD